MATIEQHTIYTNVALQPDGTVWWEGHDDPPPAAALDWQGQPWTPKRAEKAAHPNSRFTAPAAQCPSLSPDVAEPAGRADQRDPLRRAPPRRVPLVFQAFDWQHGTFLGATLASETTAAATGKVGVLRRDPMAMLPFCGYNMGDYWGHWLDVGAKPVAPAEDLPRQLVPAGRERASSSGPASARTCACSSGSSSAARDGGKAEETPIGYRPGSGAISTHGLDVTPAAMKALLDVDREAWQTNHRSQAEYFQKFGDRLPRGIRAEWVALGSRLRAR